VRELQAVHTLADLAHVGTGLIELEQARITAAGVHEHVSLRVGSDADAFAEVQIGRQLEEVRHRRVRDHRDVLRFRFRLAVHRPGSGEHRRNNGQALDTTPHGASWR
jgi:hypothetical protein